MRGESLDEGLRELHALEQQEAEPAPRRRKGKDRKAAEAQPLDPLPEDVETSYSLGAPGEEALAHPAPSGPEALVPHISIEAFCQRPELAAVIAKAGRDRRLSKTSLHVELGGVDAACARLETQASPNLLILDLVSDPAALLADLDRLAPYVDPTAKVIVIGAVNDITLYRELMKRGVSEYLVGPLQPLQLIQAIAALFVDPERPFLGRLCAVMAARGGAGASTIAHNLGFALAERFQLNTTLVDLDVSFGTLSLDFNQDAASGVADALAAPDRIDEVFLERLLVKHTERLSLFTAPASLDQLGEADPAAYETLLERMRRVSPFVLLDLPHVWSSWVKQTLLSCSDVVLVATPDLGALRNCKNLVDLLRAARPHDPPPLVVLNQVGAPRRPEVPPKDFADALGIEPQAVVPFDPAVFGAAANNGQMLFETAPAAKCTLAVEAVARRLCGREPAAPARASLLSRLPFRSR